MKNKHDLERVEMYSANYDEAKEFGFNPQNRMINHGHVNQIKKAMEAGDLPYMPPITVNERTWNIIDGQHRREAFLQLVKNGKLPENSKIEVKFVEIPREKEIEAICNANVNSKNWSVDDFIESYVKGGNVSYQKLQEFCDTHTLCSRIKITEGDTKKIVKRNYRYAVAMLKGKSGKKMLKDGSLTISNEDLAKANDIHNEVEKINNILFDGNQDPIIEGIAIAWYEYRNDATFKEWLKALKDQKCKVLKQFKNGDKFDTIFQTVGYNMLKNKK